MPTDARPPISRRSVVGSAGMAAVGGITGSLGSGATALTCMPLLEKFGGQTPIGRPGQPAELGSIYVQLAAADASYATGQVYGSAGGSGQS